MDSKADQPNLMLIVRGLMAVRKQVDDDRIAIVNNYTITSGIFGRIKRGIGSRQPFLPVFPVVQQGRTDRGSNFFIVARQIPFDILTMVITNRRQRRKVYARDQKHKLFAAQSKKTIRLPRAIPDYLRKIEQYVIALFMSVFVIDSLEVV